MSKQVTKVKNRRTSKFLTKRSLYQLKKNAVIHPLTFAKLNGGSLTLKCSEGVYMMGFSSEKLKTNACGASFQEAYRNLLRNFYEKLEWLNSKYVA